MDENDVSAAVGRVAVERIRIWAARGWIKPRREGGRLAFTAVDVARAELVVHLLDDLELSDEQVPPVLSLIDQLYGVRAAMRTLLAAIEAEPEDVRVRLRAALEGLRGGADPA